MSMGPCTSIHSTGMPAAAKTAASIQYPTPPRWVGKGIGHFFGALKIEDDSLAAVHVYFPDPWWKARHEARRLMDEPLLLAIANVLKPGGEIVILSRVGAEAGLRREGRRPLHADHLLPRRARAPLDPHRLGEVEDARLGPVAGRGAQVESRQIDVAVAREP